MQTYMAKNLIRNLLNANWTTVNEIINKSDVNASGAGMQHVS